MTTSAIVFMVASWMFVLGLTNNFTYDVGKNFTDPVPAPEVNQYVVIDATFDIRPGTEIGSAPSATVVPLAAFVALTMEYQWEGAAARVYTAVTTQE